MPVVDAEHADLLLDIEQGPSGPARNRKQDRGVIAFGVKALFAERIVVHVQQPLSVSQPSTTAQQQDAGDVQTDTKDDQYQEGPVHIYIRGAKYSITKRVHHVEDRIQR